MDANESPPTPPGAHTGTASLRWPGLMLGLAFGGFFDGIVLHQILQWHHLLSGLSGGRFADLRVQLLADGLFHALMYGLAARRWCCCSSAGAACRWQVRAAR